MNTTNKVIIGLIILVIIVWGGYALLNRNNMSAEPIKIGFFGPLTGPVAYTGEPVFTSVKLANEQQNTITNGKKVEVIYEDDACDGKKAVSAAQKLMEVDKVNILISGVCSGATLAVAPLAESKKVILISPVAASPKITDAGDYVFRISASSKVMAGAMANFIAKQGFNKIGIIYENNEYPLGYKDAFSEKFLALDKNHKVFGEGFNSGDKDVRSQFLKIKSQQPDAILLLALGAPSTKTLLNQYQELGLKTQLFGNEVFAFKSSISNSKEAIEGMKIVFYKYDLQSEAMKKFLAGYHDSYNKDVSEEIYGALGYDVYNILFNAISSCGNDKSECVKEALYHVKDYVGASGNISIDNNGDTERQFSLRKVVSGQLVEETE